MSREVKRCADCIRWYLTKADQCEVPACGLVPVGSFEQAVSGSVSMSEPDVDGALFLRKHLKYIHFTELDARKIYGKPSQLNRNNDCYFHKPLPRPLRFLTGLARFFYC